MSGTEDDPPPPLGSPMEVDEPSGHEDHEHSVGETDADVRETEGDSSAGCIDISPNDAEMSSSESEDDESYERSHGFEDEETRNNRHNELHGQMMNLIASAGLTLKSIAHSSFHKLIKMLDKKYQIPSPDQFALKFKQICDNQTFPAFSNIPKDALHLTIQIWTCQNSLDSDLIGLNVQFINEDWKLESFTRGFKHFMSESENNFGQFLLHFGVDLKQIGVIMVENAPIVTDTEVDDYEREMNKMEAGAGPTNNSEDEDEDDPYGEHDQTWTDNTVDLYHPLENDMEIEIHQERADFVSILAKTFIVDHCVEQGETKVMSKSLTHPIHTLVMDCFLKSPVLPIVKDSAVQLEQYFTFFLNSESLPKELQELTGGVKLFQTRACIWKSFALGFHRISQESFRNSVNQLLAKVRAAKPDKIVPPDVCGSFVVVAEHLSAILMPLVELIDILQGIGVTSSSVILGITNAYKAIAQVNLEKCPELNQLKTEVCGKIIEGFTKNSNSWLNVFQNEHFILAGLLDPRKKLLPFTVPSTELFGLCDLNTAIGILKSEYEKILPALRNLTPDEIQNYLQIPNIPDENDPLEFWKMNQEKFPGLSKLARIYLGFPATSGSIERMLVIGKSILRARIDEPGSLTSLETLEHIIMYQELRRSKAFPEQKNTLENFQNLSLC